MDHHGTAGLRRTIPSSVNLYTDTTSLLVERKHRGSYEYLYSVPALYIKLKYLHRSLINELCVELLGVLYLRVLYYKNTFSIMPARVHDLDMIPTGKLVIGTVYRDSANHIVECPNVTVDPYDY